MNAKYTTEPTNITHLEADINYTVIYRKCGTKEIVSYTLKRFEKYLSTDGSFVRIHKRFLVNKSFIQEVMPLKVVMLSGEILPLARRRKI